MDAATKRWIIIGAVAWAGVAALNVARAQGFANNGMGTCYSWNGGNHSSGSFIKCNDELQPAAKKAPLPPPVVASPVMMPQSAPMASCAPPPPKPVIRKKPRPKPVQC